MRPYIPEVDLNNADVHEGRSPWYTKKTAIAITRGNKIYFRPNVYDPATSAGLAFLGHELVHIGKYREGANAAKFLWSCLWGPEEETKYEKPAYALQRKIQSELAASGAAWPPCQQ